MHKSEQAKHLRSEVLGTIAAFLNSAGGTLLIGVEDEGNVCGLKNGLEIVGNSQDKFEQLLVNLISTQIGAHVAPLIGLRFELINGETVCVVNVEGASSPAFLRDGSRVQFFTRFGSTSRLLDAEEATKYIQKDWE